MADEKKRIAPYRIPHPGEVLREVIEGFTVTEVSERLHVSRVTMSKILNGRSAITAEMSLRLAVPFGWRCRTGLTYTRPWKRNSLKLYRSVKRRSLIFCKIKADGPGLTNPIILGWLDLGNPPNNYFGIHVKDFFWFFPPGSHSLQLNFSGTVVNPSIRVLDTK